MSLSATSMHTSSTYRDGDTTTCLFHCFTSFSVKEFFLISNLNLLWQREGQSIQLPCGFGLWKLILTTTCHQGTCQCSCCLCTEAGGVCSARAVSVANAQSFKNVTFLMLLLTRGTSSSQQIPAEGSSHDWSSLQREGQNHTRKQKSLGFSRRNAVPDCSVLQRLSRQWKVMCHRASSVSWCLTAGGARVCVCSLLEHPAWLP